MSAIRELESLGVSVASVDTDDIIGLSDAAELNEITRGALAKYNNETRWEGKFPNPVQRAT